MRAFQMLAIAWMGLAGCGGKLNPAATPTPGFNLFSKEQAIQIGRQAAAQVQAVNYHYSTGQFSRAQQAIRQLTAPPPARRPQSK